MKDKVELDYLVRCVKNLGPEEKQKFVSNLEQEVKLLKSKLKIRQAIGEKLDNTPTKREMIEDLACGTSAGYAVITGALSGMLTAEMTNDIILVIASAGVGCIVGLILSIISGLAYENKPISNKANAFMKHINNKQMSKLQDKIEEKSYLNNELDESEIEVM